MLMKCDKCGFDKDIISILKSQLSDLSTKVNEAEIEYQDRKKMMDIVAEMDLSSDKNTEKYRVLFRETLAKQLNALRLRTEMIQKISPESAQILTKIIDDYESANRNVFDVSGKKDPGGWELLGGFINFMIEMVGMGQKIDDVVKICSLSIRDTIKRLES